MIPIHVDTNTRNPIVYNSSPSITLNDPTDDPDDTYLVEDITIDPTWDAVVEPLPDRDGVQSHAPRQVQTLITIRGWVKAKTYAALHDKVRALNKAFDPVLNYINDDTLVDKGFVALDFTIMTEDTVNYTDGEVPARFYAAPIKRPVPLSTKFDGLNARFVIQLRCADPRMYLQSTTTVTSSSGASTSRTIDVDMSLCDYPVWPIFEFDFPTAPASLLAFARIAPTWPFPLGSTGINHADISNGDSLVLDMQKKTLELDDGTDMIESLLGSSLFFQLAPGETNTISFANLPTDATVRIIYRRALI